MDPTEIKLPPPTMNSWGAEAIADDRISFRQISAFLEVVEQQSLTRAARRLNITQSGLSKTIQSLEFILGEALLARTKKGIVLTSFGAAFMPYARRLHGCYLDALVAAADANGDQFVLAGCDIVLSELLPLLSGVGQSVSGIGPSLVANSYASHQVLDQVADGHADLGLCMYGGGRGDLDSIALLSAPVGLLSAPGLSLPPVIGSLDDLAALPLIRLADDMVLPQLLQARGVRFDAYFRSRNVCNSMLAAVAAARMGHFATIVSAVAASSRLCADLQFLPLPHLLPNLQLCLVMPRGKGELDRLRPWIQAIKDGVQQMRWQSSICRGDETGPVNAG